MRARFKFYLEDEVTTKAIDNTSNPDWSFKKQFNFTPVTAAVIIAEQFFVNCVLEVLSLKIFRVATTTLYLKIFLLTVTYM